MSLGRIVPIQKEPGLHDGQVFGSDVLRNVWIIGDLPIRITDLPDSLFIIGNLNLTEGGVTENARKKREQPHLFHR